MHFTTKIKTGLSKAVIGAFLLGTLFVNANMVHAQTQTFNDITNLPASTQEAINALSGQNIISGDGMGKFYPSGNVKRSEMIKMIVGALNVPVSDVPSTPAFKDVPATHWAFKYVEAAYKAGIVKGDGTGIFNPDQECSRQQMATMLMRSINFTDDAVKGTLVQENISRLADSNKIESWAKNSVEFAMSTGLMNGYSQNTFGPGDLAKREQVAMVIYRFLNNKANVENLVQEVLSNTGNEVPTDIRDGVTVKYPGLYDAIKNSQNFKGNVDGIMHINSKENVLNYESNVDMGISGEVNGTNSHITMQVDDPSEVLSSKDETYTVDGKAYMREWNFETNEWSIWSVEDMTQTGSDTGTPVLNYNDMMKDNQEFLQNYSSYEITKAGNAIINGQAVTKYIIPVGNEPLLGTATGAGTGSLLDEGQVTIDFYVNSQGQIIRDVYHIVSNYKDDNVDMTLTMVMDMKYSNIGKEITIIAPVTVPGTDSGSSTTPNTTPADTSSQQ